MSNWRCTACNTVVRSAGTPALCPNCGRDTFAMVIRG